MIHLLLSAFVLGPAMYCVAENEAALKQGAVPLTCTGVSILNFVLPGYAGLWSLPLVFLALVWALRKFCTPWWSRVVPVSLVYFSVHLGTLWALGSHTA